MREWWRGAVIYQIYPRSFLDTTGNGVGDLQGIVRRLPYIASLGVDGVWISPVFMSPQRDMGYDISDYEAIDPLFGTLDDFDEVISCAHRLGLKVITDQVLSHTSDKHPWFAESRQSRDNLKADWYVWADPLPDGAPPTNWHSHFGGPAWEFEPRRGQYYLHNFLAAQPDLNFHCPDVVQAILDVCRFWLDRGLDGFRLDTVNYYFHDPQLRSNPPAERTSQVMATDLYGMQQNIYNKTRPENIGFLQKLRTLTDEYDDVMMVGEVGEMGRRAIRIMSDYTRGNDRLHMAYSFEMLSSVFTAEHFRACVEDFHRLAPDGWPMWSLSNHDVVRHVSRFADHAVDPASMARLCLAMLLAFEGTICLYQGEEVGQTESELEYHELTDPPAVRFWPEVRGRDGCRTPMVWEAATPNAGFTKGTPWLPIKPPQAARAVDQQEKEPNSILSFYRKLLHFRKTRPALIEGKSRFHDLPEPVLAFTRTAKGAAMTCVFNLSPDTQQLELSAEVALDGPHNAALSDTTLTLPGNGFCYLAHQDALKLTPVGTAVAS